jgi:hypothetical protein
MCIAPRRISFVFSRRRFASNLINKIALRTLVQLLQANRHTSMQDVVRTFAVNNELGVTRGRTLPTDALRSASVTHATITCLFSMIDPRACSCYSPGRGFGSCRQPRTTDVRPSVCPSDRMHNASAEAPASQRS